MRTMSAPSTYRSKGRSWVKLWVGEWLDGTTRYEMTGAQRAFWIDLLTLAGRSRVPGVICANSENAGFFGYPLARYEGILGDDSVNVLETLKLFESQGKIELIVTRQESPTLYAVKIVSWERYQSEYMRQRKSRKSASKVTTIVTTKNTERCAIEGEVEGEVEEEVEAAETVAAFAAISCAPFGSKRFQKEWVVSFQNQRDVPRGTWADAMERTIAICKDLGVKIPGRFFAHKREIEKVEAEQAYKRVPL